MKPKFIRTARGIGEITGTEGCRVGVLGRFMNRIDYNGAPEEARLKEKLLLKGITGIEENRIVMLNQVHGDEIIILDRYPDENLPAAADADGMITNLEGLCLVIRTADCVPVFIIDGKRRVLGAAHSGWKGCRADITGRLVRTMIGRFDCEPADLLAFILPSIGPSSYRVNEDVARFFPDDIGSGEGGIYLDLWKSVESSLHREGVAADRIVNAGVCTLLDDAFFSHRRGDAGRNLNFAILRRAGQA